MDPYTYVFNKRILGIRTIVDKFPSALPLIRNICHEYAVQLHPGIYTSDENLATLQVMAPPGTPHRAKLPQSCIAHGPVGYLLQQLCEQAAQLDAHSLDIMSQFQLPMALLHMPYQHVQEQASNIATRAATTNASVNRSALQGYADIDSPVYRQAYQKRDDEQKGS